MGSMRASHVIMHPFVHLFLCVALGEETPNTGSGDIDDDDIGHPSTPTSLSTALLTTSMSGIDHSAHNQDAVFHRHNAAFAAMVVVCAIVGLAVRRKKMVVQAGFEPARFRNGA